MARMLTTNPTGQGESFNVGRFLAETSPYVWAMLGIGLCIGLSVAGAGWWVILLEGFIDRVMVRDRNRS